MTVIGPGLITFEDYGRQTIGVPGGFVALEIERKFLVTSDAWRGLALHSERIVDGLLATSKGRKVRVRLYAHRATIAIKTRKKGRVRFEFEYEIPVADARHMLEAECGRSVLAKTRHFVPHEGYTWEVDEYEAPLGGIFLAEVELTSDDEDPPLPSWVGADVTEDPAFNKTRLFAQRARQRFRLKSAGVAAAENASQPRRNSQGPRPVSTPNRHSECPLTGGMPERLPIGPA
jgi:adenylate cyclase